GPLRPISHSPGRCNAPSRRVLSRARSRRLRPLPASLRDGRFAAGEHELRRRWPLRIRDLNWMQLAEYLERDDRIVLPLGSTEQHAYLSLETDNMLAERVSAEAAEPIGVPVLPVLPYGLTPYFAAAYPGSPTLRLETFIAVIRDLLDSLYRPGFRRFLLVNGDGSFGGLYQGDDEEMLRIWQTGVEEVREILESGWRRE